MIEITNFRTTDTLPVSDLSPEICTTYLNSGTAKDIIKFPIVYNTEISYNYFIQNHLEKNEPCIFGKWLTDKWLARQRWVTTDEEINYEALASAFGSSEVPVANCSEKYYDSQKKDILLFNNYLRYMKDSSKSKECLYLKDWHFVKSFPEYKAYDVPSFFASDWLNEFWKLRCDIADDYRFVYIGPRGSWTPFHADVFRSYSWSSNICGRKRWVLYPPGEEDNMKDKFGNLIYDVEACEIKSEFNSKRYEVFQESGQTIFVPSNWHHQVWNLEDTISINHNWINATNIMIVWDFLLSSLMQVEKSIEEYSSTEEWSTQCQLILKSVHGMDFHEYFQFLKVISQRRLQYLKGDISISSFPEFKLGPNHVLYDVKKLIQCLEALLDDPHSVVLDSLPESDHPTTLLDQLQIAI